MKRLLLLSSVMLLTACGQETSHKEKAETTTTTTQDNTVTSQEMKQQLDRYMKENKQLINAVDLNDLSPTKTQLEQLKETKAKLDDNNSKLKHYMKTHDIPASYQQGTKDTLAYFEHVSALLNDAETPLAELAKGKLSSLTKLSSLSGKYSDQLGQKQQDKVKTFLKEKDIDTSLFDNNLFDLVK